MKADLDGDYIEGLDFVLKKIISETPPEATVTQTVVKKDTSYLILHEEVRELVTITEDYWAMQLGAFKTKSYAEAWMKRIAAVVDKDVELINEDGFYKVRVTGFKDREELDSYIPALQNAGFTEIWIIHNKAKYVERLVTRQDSVARITETVSEIQRPVILPGTTLQIGAFLNQEEADAILDRLLASVENLVTMRKEGGLFKVQISDVRDTADIRKLLPILEKKGFGNIVLVNPPEARPVPVTGAAIDSMIVEKAKEVAGKQPETLTEKPAPAKPGFVLHAARYYKKYEAERAKNRIIRKLGLPAEIRQEWDSYRVVVTGFFTREETFKYYPELAGLGFREVYVIELPPQERK
ncbi:MAG: SPOR domain-containing protein [Bacteroidales bacterium]|nr:SPOR domain-containing protein [Bacteroidales bacterium]